MRRLDPEQLVRLGNAAYGAGLCLLMLGESEEAAVWLGRASARWRESWEHATPTSWGRPIGVIKAALIAQDDEAAGSFAAWALALGCEEAESPIGQYAADARPARRAVETPRRHRSRKACASVTTFRTRLPRRSSGSQSAPRAGTARRSQQVLRSFETRDEYLEDVPVADTVLVLQALAAGRGLAVELASPLLPG